MLRNATLFKVDTLPLLSMVFIGSLSAFSFHTCSFFYLVFLSSLLKFCVEKKAYRGVQFDTHLLNEDENSKREVVDVVGRLAEKLNAIAIDAQELKALIHPPGAVNVNGTRLSVSSASEHD